MISQYQHSVALKLVVEHIIPFTLTDSRLQSRGSEPLTTGLQSLRLASRLKPWLRTSDGLRWLMAASHGLRVQTGQERPAVADKPARRLRKVCTAYVRAVGL